MHNVWNSDDQSRKDPNSNDHSLGSMFRGVPPEDKDRKGVNSDGLKSACQKISGETQWQKIYTRDLSIFKKHKPDNTGGKKLPIRTSMPHHLSQLALKPPAPCIDDPL